ncbi:uncharacterized protein LOC121923311 [Sceloporus undulatus]|uniref:uncharacterized protein LOC121923311 n=1 Tax=Sceloporus undulatus TaxID=8520 RepID=UPI001C4BD45C|nr:uncharacterized protein LOC121923311 [Sceloporus undulatus]
MAKMTRGINNVVSRVMDGCGGQRAVNVTSWVAPKLISVFVVYFCCFVCCCFLRPSQSLAHILMEDPSPTAQLIQLAEQHHREISQLADAHLTGSQSASMFPHIVKRGESDSRPNTESYDESQPGLSRSNSESHLLQMGKQKKRKGKENRKGYIQYRSQASSQTCFQKTALVYGRSSGQEAGFATTRAQMAETSGLSRQDTPGLSFEGLRGGDNRSEELVHFCAYRVRGVASSRAVQGSEGAYSTPSSPEPYFGTIESLLRRD